MDIAIVGKNSIKIKGKNVTFIIDPEVKMPKSQADAVILLDGLRNIDTQRVIDSRVIINGQGGYEVNGAKISGTRTSKGILHKLSIDGISIILGKTAEVKTEGFDECQVAIINADSEFNESLVTAMEPRIVVLYGEKKEDAAKKLGAENLTLVPKTTIIKDKLPEKMETIILN